jgi:hypothetical protein
MDFSRGREKVLLGKRKDVIMTYWIRIRYALLRTEDGLVVQWY